MMEKEKPILVKEFYVRVEFYCYPPTVNNLSKHDLNNFERYKNKSIIYLRRWENDDFGWLCEFKNMRRLYIDFEKDARAETLPYLDKLEGLAVTDTNLNWDSIVQKTPNLESLQFICKGIGGVSNYLHYWKNLWRMYLYEIDIYDINELVNISQHVKESEYGISIVIESREIFLLGLSFENKQEIIEAYIKKPLSKEIIEL